MTVLHLISSSGFFGAEKVVLTLARNGHAVGMRSIIGVIEDQRTGPSALAGRARKEGLPVATFPSAGRWDVNVPGRVAGFLKENAVNILHTHNYKSDLIGLWAARQAGVPVMATAHGFTGMNAKVSFYERLDRWVLARMFDRVVVVTEQMLPSMPSEKRRVIPNGLDTQRLAETSGRRETVRSSWGLSPSAVLAGTVGRLSPEKNQAALVRAVAHLREKGVPVKAVIVGEGPCRTEIEAEIAQYQLGAEVILTGLRDDVDDLYAAMDIFVLPSLTEGVPLTILEAQAAGVPVAASSVGGVPEIIGDGETGLLFDPGDDAGLVTAMERLIADKPLRARLAAEGQTRVREKFSLEKMRESYRTVYEELLK